MHSLVMTVSGTRASLDVLPHGGECTGHRNNTLSIVSIVMIHIAISNFHRYSTTIHPDNKYIS